MRQARASFRSRGEVSSFRSFRTSRVTFLVSCNCGCGSWGPKDHNCWSKNTTAAAGHPQPSTTKTPRRTKRIRDAAARTVSISCFNVWLQKYVHHHTMTHQLGSENFIQFTNYTVFHLWPILLIWNLSESWLELKCMSKCHWNDEFGAQKSSLMLLFVKALYDAHSLVDGCDKDGDAGVVVASSPGALQCRNRLTSRLRCWTKIQLTVWHVFLSLYLQGSLHFPVGGILSCLLTISNSANGHHFAQEEAQVERQNGFAKCFDTKKMEAGNEKLLKVGGRFVRCLFKNQVCCS